MGSGIAYVCARAGYRVKLVDKDSESVESGIRRIKETVDVGLKKGKISEGQAAEIMRRVQASVGLREAVHDADLVLEAVYEDLELKKSVFTMVRDMCPPTAILASNTSSLSIRELSSSSGRSGRFLGIHFFNPPTQMKLVEVVLCPETSKAILDMVKEFVESLGKHWVLVKDSPGFIVNRLLAPMLNEAAYLVQEGIASIEDIDEAIMLGAGLPMGPLALSDLIGIDVLQAIMNNLEKGLGDKYAPCPLLDEKIRLKQLGKKTALGYYKY